MYITMYCNSTAVARVGAAAATPGVDKIRSIDEALRLSEKADNTTLPYSFKFAGILYKFGNTNGPKT